MLTEIPSWGLKIAPGLPAPAFNEMSGLSATLSTPLRAHVMRAWTAVAFRHRSCHDETKAFPYELQKLAEDAYNYDRSLFVFFTSCLSAIESAVFASYALGSHIDPIGFPMESAEDQRRVTLSTTSDRFTKGFAETVLAKALTELRNDGDMKNVLEVRNYILHRSVPGRTIAVILGGPPVPDAWGPFALPLTNTLSKSYLDWLGRWLDRLLTGSVVFLRERSSAP